MMLMFITGSRGEWGYIRPVILEAQKRGHTTSICATNMHLSTGTDRFIEADGFTVDYRIPMPPHDSNDTHAMALGAFLSGLGPVICSKPDWIVLAGDRGEQLMGAIAGAYSYIPTAHIQAGERSGNIDNSARMAIAKLAHIHFTANQDASHRLILMGEEPWRINETGAPQLDEIQRGSPRPIDEPYILVVFHPTTNEANMALEQVRALKEALHKTNIKRVWIAPNNDPGNAAIRAEIPGDALTSIPRSEYLQLLEHAECIVGNSSSGLLEAPSFGTPCVNIGLRQQDRVHGLNVVNVKEYHSDKIYHAIEDTLDMERVHINPYGDGHSSPRIIDCLEAFHGRDNLCNKRMAY